MSWFSSWTGKHSRTQKSSHRSVTLHLEALEEREVPTVYFYGGSVLPHVEAQALYLGKEWSTVPANVAQTATLDGFLTDLTGGPYMAALQRAGYGVGPGTASAGYVDGTTLSPGSTITDASIQATIRADILNGHLNAPDANRLYIVYVEPNIAVNLGAGQGTTQQGILGYHGAFAGPNGITIHYAVVAYPGGTAGNSSLGTTARDQLTAVTSHELAEAVTDPNVNFGQLGWYDPRRGEIGDITENNPNALVRLGQYLVQEVADKNDQLLSIFTNPTPPVPPPSGVITTSTTLTASAVRYHWFGPPTVTLTITIAPGSGSVAPDGTVELLYNGSVLGTAKVRVIHGVATASFTVAFYGSGSYSFSAQYVGTTQFQGSLSNSVTVNV